MTALTGKAHCSPEELYLFSCEKHVRADTPPTFLWHTAEDECVPVMNSLLYAQALAANHVPFELHVFPQGEHRAFNKRPANDPQRRRGASIRPHMAGLCQELVEHYVETLNP